MRKMGEKERERISLEAIAFNTQISKADKGKDFVSVASACNRNLLLLNFRALERQILFLLARLEDPNCPSSLKKKKHAIRSYAEELLNSTLISILKAGSTNISKDILEKMTQLHLFLDEGRRK